MSDFGRRLAQGPLLLLDGGLGSGLIARGLPAGGAPELWNLERPEDVLAVHRSFVEAGSEAIHTNTFGANAARLSRFGAENRLPEINRAGVRLARSAGPRYLLGDIGPTGEYLPPIGSGDPERWRAQFRRQGEILAEAGVDALHLETMSDLREALLALEGLQETVPGVPLLASLTFERKKRGFFTIMGDPLGPALKSLTQAGASAVGANCSITSREMVELAREALELPGLSLVFQPNAGVPRVTSDGVTYAQDPEQFAEEMSSLVGRSDSRIAALGGCCGTDAAFIAALSRRLAAGR